jgi:hypothetical protein
MPIQQGCHTPIEIIRETNELELRSIDRYFPMHSILYRSLELYISLVALGMLKTPLCSFVSFVVNRFW